MTTTEKPSRGAQILNGIVTILGFLLIVWLLAGVYDHFQYRRAF